MMQSFEEIMPTFGRRWVPSGSVSRIKERSEKA
jgi:hypothetical protein